MANWEQWLNNDERGHRIAKKPDKNYYCRKNRKGKYYGPHAYGQDGRCQFCLRIKNKSNIEDDIIDEKGESV